MKKTRIFEILHEEGLRGRQQESWFGKRVDPDFAKKRGPSSGSARKLQPTDSAILDIDEMGPVSAKSYPGQEAIKVTVRKAKAG